MKEQGWCFIFFFYLIDLNNIRSRFGKTLLPKNGLISNIVSAVRSGEIPDVLLVSVSISYDSTIEGILFNELKGSKKKRENILTVFGGFLSCFGTGQRCGDIVIDYGTPVLLSVCFKYVVKFFSRLLY